MARKKSKDDATTPKKTNNPNVMGLQAQVVEQPITETLEVNFMPYAMSVILSRAIPEIDGFKPSHRKLLYTMYKMGLLNGGRTKCANIVGQTMRLNPHGDAAIYDTLVRLSRGHEALLAPFVDSKGNFGKVYSRDMAYAASRYTEAKLEPICAELFRDIDQDTVDFNDNYDATMQEPALLPTTFPNVLVSSNLGIAVGMASNICGFNLTEVCQTTIAYIKDPAHPIIETLKAPDFPTGGEILYDRAAMEEVYRTGRGPIRLRAKWRYLKEGNMIEVFEIPYTTTTEAIMDKVAELIRQGKVKEISDMRDETDLSGMKLTIDLKRGTDPDKLMAKLMKQTTLMDTFSCNFNILTGGMPQVMGVTEILDEWIAWRTECVKRRTYHILQGKQEKLHLLQGLEQILLDIDKAIAIIRSTETDAEVVPNLMIGFGIDQVQAEYVAEIRLRNINKEYILKRTAEIADLEKEIAELQDLLASRRKVLNTIVRELEAVIKKYPSPRKTTLVEDVQEPEPESEEIPDYPVTIFVTKQGYFKKITPQSLRMSGEQKYKEGDGLELSMEVTNRSELLVFTDQCQVYKTRCADFDDGKASTLGDFLPAKLGMDEGESVKAVLASGDYTGHVLFAFENGKVARVPLEGYATKTNRRKLTGAYSDKSPLVKILPLDQERELVLRSTDSRTVIINTALLTPKTTRSTQGVNVISLKRGKAVEAAAFLDETNIQNVSRYRVRAIPAAGALLRPEDQGEEQLALDLQS